MKEQEEVKKQFNGFINNASTNCIFKTLNPEIGSNKLALETAESIYNDSRKGIVQNAFGSNCGSVMMRQINDCSYLFPQNSTFYAKDVLEIGKHLEHQYFDLILLDPPWWNKYIRRKRKKSSDGYEMMFNEDLKSLPVEKLLKDDGLVVVWCTNSEQNFNHLVNHIFPKWGVEYSSKWFWLKVTTQGKPVCNFSEPPGKQPYEKIVFGYKKRLLPVPQDGQLIISIPSALHSHKPPLVELLHDYLPENPRCLEVFARYLLPEWTSYGNEVLRLQHESLFQTRRLIKANSASNDCAMLFLKNGSSLLNEKKVQSGVAINPGRVTRIESSL
ncbi:hypothetical protein JTB14_005749 [Gonioctena quinquepunctata]|nr:hypothetical protein JTB14_005749 [Gonioctena quinquepunctata]